MKFSEMFGFLRMRNPEKIVFIKSGAFYIAEAQDAVFLSKQLSLKTICYKKNVCKVGVPINSLKKYLNKLDEAGYAYIVYSFDKEKKELIPEIVKEGKSHTELEPNKKCLLCKMHMNIEDEDIYMEALKKLNEYEGK